MPTSPAEGVSPNEVCVRSDLGGEAFLAGVRQGRWRDPVLEWPHLYIDVAVGDEEFARLRLDLDEYPARAPHGQLWDPRHGAPLAVSLWPRGGSADRVFRTDWSPDNQNAPYLPCDRVGLTTHANWAAEMPERAWNVSRTVAFYVAEIASELTDARLPKDQAEAA